MSYQVSIEKCGSYDDHEVRKAIAACLAPLGGLESVVADGDHVLVKLNLLSAKSPDAAVTTHPAIAKATVELVLELGATPVLGDSAGGGSTAASYKALLEKTGQHLEAVIAVKPVIDVSNCKRCGECYMACPPTPLCLKKPGYRTLVIASVYAVIAARSYARRVLLPLLPPLLEDY